MIQVSDRLTQPTRVVKTIVRSCTLARPGATCHATRAFPGYKQQKSQPTPPVTHMDSNPNFRSSDYMKAVGMSDSQSVRPHPVGGGQGRCWQAAILQPAAQAQLRASSGSACGSTCQYSRAKPELRACDDAVTHAPWCPLPLAVVHVAWGCPIVDGHTWVF